MEQKQIDKSKKRESKTLSDKRESVDKSTPKYSVANLFNGEDDILQIIHQTNSRHLNLKEAITAIFCKTSPNSKNLNE